MGQWDGSGRDGACRQARWPEFTSRIVRWRDLILTHMVEGESYSQKLFSDFYITRALCTHTCTYNT